MTADNAGNELAQISSTGDSAADDVPGWLSRLAAATREVQVPDPLRPPDGSGRPAAVLILFADGDAGPEVLLIERAAELRSHPGQPAFPGGAIDPSDGGPVQAALRETAEETGVDPAGVRVLAVLPEMYISRTDFRVTPVLAWWHAPVPVAPGDPAEIAAVIRVPVADLAQPANRMVIRYPNGQAGYAFRVAGLIVWGFTAMLIDRLLALAGWERPWDSSRVTTLSADELPVGWPAIGT